MARVAPSERLRRELDELLAGVDGEADPLERIGRLGARLILQQALEDEVTEFLGRVRYERAEEPVSHRNGYEPRRVVTTAGPVELERPRVRNARELGFESRILGRHVARTYALESLIICSFLRGLSVRDVEAALAETFDERWKAARCCSGSPWAAATVIPLPPQPGAARHESPARPRRAVVADSAWPPHDDGASSPGCSPNAPGAVGSSPSGVR
jgi:putative transposase